MTTNPDHKLAQAAMKLGLLTKQQAKENLRILSLRGDIREPTTLDRVLFERKVLKAKEVYRLQRKVKRRDVFCSKCAHRQDAFTQKPGSRMKCVKCRTKIEVPGFNLSDPFETRGASGKGAGAPVSVTWSEIVLGVLLVFACGALLVRGGIESWETHMGLPAMIASGGFLLVGALLASRRRFLAAGGVGLAVLAGLAVASALGASPENSAYNTAGLGAHQLLPGLILAHILWLLLVGGTGLVRAGANKTLLLLLVPCLYGAAFFALRCVPGSDPLQYLTGGHSALEQLPWYLHPGVVTLIFLFPLGALALVGSNTWKLLRGKPNRLLLHLGPTVGLLLLCGFGLTVGAVRDEIPSPELKAQVEEQLAGRVALWWREAGRDAAVASTAAALTVEEGEAVAQATEGEDEEKSP